jgi:protein SCO1/2
MVRKKTNGDEISNGKSGPEGRRGEASPSIRKGGVFPLILAVLVVAGGGLSAALFWRSAPPPAVGDAGLAVGGAFHLVDQDGRPVDQHLLDGKWSAVFFGYTYCPDTCPATLQALGAASRQLGDAAKAFQVVFITVDPARDTPAQMKTYLQSQGFPAHAIGLTGSPTQIAEVAKAYSVYYAKAGSGADYTMDHSAAVYLMDPRGRFSRPLSHDMTPTLIAQQIKAAQRGT